MVSKGAGKKLDAAYDVKTVEFWEDFTAAKLRIIERMNESDDPVFLDTCVWVLAEFGERVERNADGKWQRCYIYKGELRFY